MKKLLKSEICESMNSKKIGLKLMKKKKVEMQTHISAVSAQSKRALGE